MNPLHRAAWAAWPALACLGAYLAAHEALVGSAPDLRRTALVQVLLCTACVASAGRRRPLAGGDAAAAERGIPWRFAATVSGVAAVLGAWVLERGGESEAQPAWTELMVALALAAVAAAVAARLTRSAVLTRRLAGYAFVLAFWWPAFGNHPPRSRLGLPPQVTPVAAPERVSPPSRPVRWPRW